jgi:phytoene dehydrogenase-like protein
MKVGIVGGGHNGLVLAGYLARDGFDVTVLEARDRVGGLCVNEEVFPGHAISTVASYYGMFRRQIIEDLRLDVHGLQPYLTDPAEIVLLPNGGYVFTPRDGSESKISAGELSDEDRQGWIRFWTDMGKGAALIAPLYFEPKTTRKQLVELLKENGLDVLAKNLFDGSLFDVFDHYCKNQFLKSAAATCTPGFASNKGSVFGCMHHGTAETCGVQGAWGLVRGGMGKVSEALAKSAESSGVKIKTGAKVASIEVEGNRATGVKLADGSIERFDFVVSNVDPISTLKGLLPGVKLSRELKELVDAPISSVSACKVHFLLRRLPSFPTLDMLNHNYAGIIVVAPPVEGVIADSKRVANGQMPQNLMMTMAFPTVTDDTVAPAGQHHMNMDIHTWPVTDEGEPWNEASRAKIRAAVIEALKPFAPDIEDVIEDTFIVSPGDLSSRYGVSTSMCWHLPMTSEYVFEKRNLPGCQPYGSPVENLYLCGAATFGGGNVTGIAGYNCARVLIESKMRVNA